MKNKEIEQEKIKLKNSTDLQSAEACIVAAQHAYAENKLDDAMYWVSMAGVYCKLIQARRV